MFWMKIWWLNKSHKVIWDLKNVSSLIFFRMNKDKLYLLFISYLIVYVICSKEINIFGTEVTAMYFMWESIAVYKKIFDEWHLN